MPKPNPKGRGGKGRRPARVGKKAAKGRRPKTKAMKPVAPKGRPVAAKKKVRTPARPAQRAGKPAPVPRTQVAAPKPAPPLERKEATRMSAGANCPIHNSPDCYKPALDAHIQKAYDGYCTKIDWPYWRIIPKGWKAGR